MNTLLTFIQLLFSGFQYTVVILFFLKLLFRKNDVFWRRLFLLSNSILLVMSLVYGAVLLIDFGIIFIDRSDDPLDNFRWRVLGPYWYSYFLMFLVPLLAPQIFWFRRFRHSYKASLIVIPFLAIGSIFERLVIIITTLYRDYLPSSWTYYAPRPGEMLIAFLSFAVVLTIVYFFYRKRIDLS